MNKLFVALLAFSLFVLPMVSASPLWRVGLSRVSTYHQANTCDWLRGTGHGTVEEYVPTCMEEECNPPVEDLPPCTEECNGGVEE